MRKLKLTLPQMRYIIIIRNELSVDGCSECLVKYHVAFQAGRDIFYILMPDVFNQGDQCNNEHPQSQKIGKC